MRSGERACCPGCHKELLEDQYETTNSIWCKNCWEERKSDIFEAIRIMKVKDLEQKERHRIWRTK